MKKTLLFFLLVILFVPGVYAQYPPPAGEPGTTAIYKDSAVFKTWATGCSVVRGFVNISDTTITYEGQNRAFYGNDADGTGAPDDFSVSLGDGGIATLTFDHPIGNGEGPDFAIFENSAADGFLELGFVEVSSDGSRYVRFPAVSLTQVETQVSTFGTLDATKLNNFAGKYRLFYGTPFDLADISDSTGIDLNHITYVRIIDVVGCIQPLYATYDSQGDTINDPWPTPFHSCGFDLDAAGIINLGPQAINDETDPIILNIFPNPVNSNVSISITQAGPGWLRVTDLTGQTRLQISTLQNFQKIDLGHLAPGIYFLTVRLENGREISKKIIKN
jgi:hypothetical protein